MVCCIFFSLEYMIITCEIDYTNILPVNVAKNTRYIQETFLKKLHLHLLVPLHLSTRSLHKVSPVWLAASDYSH